VASAVVHLLPREDRPDRTLLAALERVTAAAFGQRRKMLRSSLKTLGGADLCEAAGLEPDVRAEVVDGAGFLRLARSVLGLPVVRPGAEGDGVTLARRKRT
jgi:16S rRNA (adenine1518-N6/adenine1519-N6)-dimethyltransferase